jgi:NADP-dependent 3-hydroxy acid dehydrogenase YdfG
MSRLLENKTAIVTGASSGIGQATARALAQLGAAVVIHARREDRLDALASDIAAAGGLALAVVGDASRPGDIDLLLEKTLDWDQGGNRYDIVVVNAGRGLAGSLLGSDEAQWREVFGLNVMGAAHLMRKAGQYLAGRRTGDIVVLGSVAGHNISPFSSFYGSSKFAVGALAEGLRREIGPQGVRISLVKPGVVLSEFQAVAGYTEENFGKGVAQYGRLLEPGDIAEGICWLLTLPQHVNVGEIVIRPTGQNYP